MLRTLDLRDFLFIEQAEISFGEGFCALTGETGAGKSILLDALGLALGARADSGVVRGGAARAEIVAEFSTTGDIAAWLAEQALDLPAAEGADDPAEPVLLRRVIDRDGRSRAFVNGSPVTVGQLRDCGQRLLEIHGQHASQALLQPDGQRMLLDAFGQSVAAARSLEQLWRDWRVARETLEAASAGEREREQALAGIDWQLEGIDALSPAAGEWQTLNDEQTRLAHGRELLETAGAVADALGGQEGSVRDTLETLLGQLRTARRLDPSLGDAIEMLEAARINIDESASTLTRYVERGDLDPARLAEIEQRLADWFALGRRLRVDPAELIGHAESLRAQRDALTRAGDLEALQASAAAAQARWTDAAKALSARRAAQAASLAERVSSLLPELGMAAARFEVRLEPVDPGPGGLERIGFWFSGHPDLPPRPLAKVASGGELSRLSLAITVVAADANPVPTLIFDEADAGVGGTVADAIGRLMRRLGRDRQILAVTHLPQVAACAHWHLRVSRESDSVRRLEALQPAERVEEIARMLGGGAASLTSRDHARELIAHAAAEKPGATTPPVASDAAAPAVKAAGSAPRSARRAPAGAKARSGPAPAKRKQAERDAPTKASKKPGRKAARGS